MPMVNWAKKQPTSRPSFAKSTKLSCTSSRPTSGAFAPAKNAYFAHLVSLEVVVPFSSPIETTGRPQTDCYLYLEHTMTNGTY
ncbi:LOW QUALITY PROTEIN: hypothetical protein SPRG_18618 [Saprolegnia parasitica CBS 223.65]|uniref:Uncharacterized protein n=1 Tax=Saprolegnia parasitica (strain CBS 223.65) TaxID=695850 RepID=A0A067BN96_SAPPC|nr:LOW QUALITY PROTEIN: hypothetical protein SPRG_18618 [Saprolegnia parasitica CBS 223.65]KDO15841.1 LOW QUALITY PROTEIN: hypothetical protein SPRG_18618 [Saprolegnia parasitica CBS 223.65]|eukprot:XP_012213449.1 LOW QUALITY PROTEIN: hypothetical protein SPRG_18618 [Saprolegnia parasitica CBS 223.65]